MEQFMMGAIALASWTAAIFFMRFWRDTGDRLFAIFSVSFILLGITRLGLAMQNEQLEAQTYWYWVRLTAFLLILLAIADKNRVSNRTSSV
jgi:hypothetical protein